MAFRRCLVVLSAPSRVDQLTVGDHYRLANNDEVYYFGEYTAYEGYGFSPTNQLVVNLKHGVEHRGKPRWRYKQQAIAEVARSLARHISDEFARVATFVPIPPSVVRADPSYDDRNLEVLRQFQALKIGVDVRDLLYQTQSTRKSHQSAERLQVDDLMSVYKVDNRLTNPRPQAIVLFDDVLTTGTHFVAARNVLREQFGGLRFAGVMIARRKPPSIEFEADAILDF